LNPLNELYLTTSYTCKLKVKSCRAPEKIQHCVVHRNRKQWRCSVNH